MLSCLPRSVEPQGAKLLLTKDRELPCMFPFGLRAAVQHTQMLIWMEQPDCAMSELRQVEFAFKSDSQTG